jgi:hypothetical protein
MAFAITPLKEALSGDKVVNSKLLNLLGVQVQRTLAARLIYNLRRGPVDHAVKDKIDELRREGLVIWPDFLPPDHFAGLQREYLPLLDGHADQLTVYQHGPNTYEIAQIRNYDESVLPHTYKFLAEPRLQALLEGAERRPLHRLSGHRVLERLIQGPDGEKEDPETILHSDTFFTNHKAWLYLSDVDMDNAPFVFVRRSHHVTPTRLYYIYKESCAGNRGSRRIARDEVEQLNMQETTVICPKNTLVIANVAGFHRRVRGRPGCRRYAVHVSLRVNPFLWWRFREVSPKY